MHQDRRPDALRWVGHATVVVDLDGVRVVTDPVLRPRAGLLRRHGAALERSWWERADLVVVSHLHADHLDLGSLRLLSSSARVVAPRGAARLLRRAGVRDVVEVVAGDVVQHGGLAVEAVPARHDGRRRPGPRAAVAAPVGYLLRGSTRVWFAGDTDVFPEMADLRDRVDVTALPVGGWGLTLGTGHLDAERAAAVLRVVRPRVAVPVHWGTLRPMGLRRLRPGLFVDPGPDFARHAAALAPDVAVAVLAPGDSLDPRLLPTRQGDEPPQRPRRTAR